MTDLRDANSFHPLFRAMVLMGGSLALQCGGSASHHGSAGGGQASGGSGEGGAPTAGGGSAGGSTANGGAEPISAGGVPEPVNPGPFACPPAQWDCGAVSPSCWSGSFELPEGCACDSTRPLGPADCVDSDWVCRRATHDSQQRPLSSDVEFECACAPHAASCRAACEGVFGNESSCARADSAMNAVLCDCAVIVLR